MRNVVLYTAMSLDGYLADRDGGVGWLSGQDPNAEDPDTYASFIRDVDTVLMGWNTYHQVTTELSPSVWPYHGLTSYVITHRALSSSEEIRFTQMEPCRLVCTLREASGRDIWICGGAEIIRPLIEEDLIDIYRISVIPVLLGGGKVLFDPVERPLALRLTGYQQGNGIVELTYTRR